MVGDKGPELVVPFTLEQLRYLAERAAVVRRRYRCHWWQFWKPRLRYRIGGEATVKTAITEYRRIAEYRRSMLRPWQTLPHVACSRCGASATRVTFPTKAGDEMPELAVMTCEEHEQDVQNGFLDVDTGASSRQLRMSWGQWAYGLNPLLVVWRFRRSERRAQRTGVPNIYL